MGLTPKVARILAPTDFSSSTEVACSLAARLANRLEAELLVIHVIPTAEMALKVGTVADRTREEILNKSYKGLRVWFEDVVPGELRRFLTVEVHIAVGEPALEIASAASSKGADLIVMATHGRSGIGHLVMGSVTESVLRTAPAPVLALRAGQEGRPLTEVKRILWATDLSPASEEAWRYALMFADTLSAEVSLLHVVNSTELAGIADMPVPPSAGWLEGQLAAIEKELVTRQREVESLGLSARRKVTVGPPAVAIVAEAQAEQVDLIVMGTHGRTGLTHILLGSVAEAVLRKAPCPVLVVRAKREREPEWSGSGMAQAQAETS